MHLHKQLRVAHVIYSPAVGGSEIFSAEVCSHLKRSIYDPIILFMYPGVGRMPELLSQRDIAFYNLKRSRIRRILWPFLPAFTLRRLKINLLHVHHIPLLKAITPAAKFAGIRSIVFTEHAKFSITKSYKLQKECRKAAINVGCFTTVSDALKDYFVNEVGISADTIKVIKNGVDTRRYIPGKRSAVLNSLLPSDFKGSVLITVGRLAEAKDHFCLLSALEKVRKRGINLYLIVVGDGELRDSIEKEINKRELNRHVLMAGSRSDIDQLLPGVDAFILSSKREGLPIAILEAMSAALPVISTSVGGVPEVIKTDFNGLLVPPEDSTSLADAIAHICENKTVAKQLGENARSTILKKFSMEQIAISFSEIYQELIQKNQ